MKLAFAMVSALTIFASSAKAETFSESPGQAMEASASCQSIGGLYVKGYCIVRANDNNVPDDAKWVIKDGQSYAVAKVNGKNVIFFEPPIVRGLAEWISIAIDLLESDEIGCSGRYTC